MKKMIALFIFLLAAQLGHASHQIEEMKMEPSSHHGFIREIVTDLVEHIMDDEAPVTINMATYRFLMRKDNDSDKRAALAFYQDNLMLEQELQRKDFVVAKAIDSLIRAEKREAESLLYESISRLKWAEEEFGYNEQAVDAKYIRLGQYGGSQHTLEKEKIEKVNKPIISDLQKNVEKFQYYVSLYNTEDKILLAQQNKKKTFYLVYDEIINQR